jgi:allantoin racemase
VFSNDKHEARVAENIRGYGLTGRVAATARMEVAKLTDLEAAFTPGAVRDSVLAQFHKAAEDCVARGAEVVIPTVGVAMVLLYEAGVHETARGALVLCGPLALVQQGQAAVKLKRAMGGRFTSRRGAYGQPPPAQIAELRRYHGEVYPGVGR